MIDPVSRRPVSPRSPASRRWPGYAMIWRWHFYAGLFCVPFVLWLACTGSVYLFRPQIEALIDRPYDDLAVAGARSTAVAQVAAGERAVPGSAFRRYELPLSPASAVRVIVARQGVETRVYVDPYTLRVLKTVGEDDRLMRIVFRLHGELLAGDTGSYLVELAASWAIVMIVSGLFLWWPRGQGMAGVLWPRLGRDAQGSSRGWWRDIHAVTGFYVSFFALFMLVTGLPWAKSWGTYLQEIRTLSSGPATTPPDWAIGHVGMVMTGPGGMAAVTATDLAPLDRLVAKAASLDLAPPVVIVPPKSMAGPWTVRSDAADRPLRTTLTLDQSGHVLTREDFSTRPLLDRIVGTGVAVHEGQLFGLANQLLGLATALGLVTLCVSSVQLWLRRRPGGVLGAPTATTRPLAFGFVALLVVLGVVLPMLGGSMILVVLAERLVLRRLPRAGRWLGLRPAG